jgi:polyisoprenoid-binding protein YceI
MKRVHWMIDTMHSEILFKVKHLMLTTITGHFENFKAEVETEGEDFENTHNIHFIADVNSLSTKNSQRDNHLKSPDFFDAANFPQIEFRAKGFTASTEKLNGDLTIRGKTLPVILDAEFSGIVIDSMGQKKAGFSLSGKISRKSFGLHWNALTEAGGVVVGDEVKILAEIQFAQAKVETENAIEELAS